MTAIETTTIQVNPDSTRQRQRWIKVSVDEDLFLEVHDAANKSRMLMSTYLRTLFSEGYVYHNSSGVSFRASR